MDYPLPLLSLVRAYLSRNGDDGTALGDLRLHTVWLDFYEKYLPIVHEIAGREARRWKLDPDDAEDEAWLVFCKQLPHYWHDPQRGPFTAWLSVVVRRAVRALARREKRHKAVHADDEFLAESFRMESGIERWDEGVEIRAQVHRWFETLRGVVSETDYQIMVWYWLNGKSDEEIASILGITRKHVRAHRARAMKALRTLVESNQDP